MVARSNDEKWEEERTHERQLGKEEEDQLVRERQRERERERESEGATGQSGKIDRAQKGGER